MRSLSVALEFGRGALEAQGAGPSVARLEAPPGVTIADRARRTDAHERLETAGQQRLRADAKALDAFHGLVQRHVDDLKPVVRQQVDGA